MHSGFSQLLGKLVVKYVSTYTKATLKKRSAEDLWFLSMFLSFFLLFFFYSDFLYKAYDVGTHLNCTDKSM